MGQARGNVPEYALGLESGRNGDGVVEDASGDVNDRYHEVMDDTSLQTERLVRLGTALGAVEEVLLDILQDIEPGAASCVRDGLAVGARRPPVDRDGYQMQQTVNIRA